MLKYFTLKFHEKVILLMKKVDFWVCSQQIKLLKTKLYIQHKLSLLSTYL